MGQVFGRKSSRKCRISRIVKPPPLVRGKFITKEKHMETLTKIPPAVAALIPELQLKFTKEFLHKYSGAIKRLEALLEKCPYIGETDGMEEHPAFFHYFYGSTDIFICEYDRNDKMFGYAILGGDLPNSEWGYFNLSDITSVPQFNLDYHFEEQTIEAALFKGYPTYFKIPKSLTA
jgi:hypothetical protein